MRRVFLEHIPDSTKSPVALRTNGFHGDQSEAMDFKGQDWKLPLGEVFGEYQGEGSSPSPQKSSHQDMLGVLVWMICP